MFVVCAHCGLLTSWTEGLGNRNRVVTAIGWTTLESWFHSWQGKESLLQSVRLVIFNGQYVHFPRGYSSRGVKLTFPCNSRD